MFVIYTDGSCLGNPGPGGWAAIIDKGPGTMDNEEEVILSGAEKLTTNNIMELTAAIKALTRVWEKESEEHWQRTTDDAQDGLFATAHAPTLKKKVSGATIIITDSNYVKLGITEWMSTWKRRQRRRAKGGKLVENVLLRKELDALVSCFTQLEWQRTKAHVGTEMNERVDQLAREAAGER